MAIYQFNHWKINVDTGELIHISSGDCVQLEHQMNALLAYFIENNDRIVSRDELAQHVWPNTVVEDNTISKAITRLRKTLNDDPKQAKILKTVPKRGYRFVAQLQDVNATSNSKRSPIIFGSIASLVVLFGIIFWIFGASKNHPELQNSDPNIVSYDAVPLTAMSSREYNSSFSTNNQDFSFVSEQNGELWIYIKQANQSLPTPITRVSESSVYPQWSPFAQEIIYADSDKEGCHISLISGKDGTFSSAMVKRCNEIELASLRWSHDGSGFYYVEKSESGGAKLIYHNDNQSKVVPVIVNQGELLLAVPSPDGKLVGMLFRRADDNYVISIQTIASKEVVAELNIGYPIDNFVFSSNSNAVVHAGKHPSRNIVERAFDNATKNIAVSQMGYLQQVSGIPNTKDFSVTSTFIDRDIVAETYATDSNSIRTLVDTTYPDYNGQLSNSGKQLAFVSKRTGQAEIWIEQSGQLRQLSAFNDSYYVHELLWTQNDQFLFARTHKSIIRFDTQSGVFETVTLGNDNVAFMGLFNHSTVYLGIKNSDRIEAPVQLISLNIDTKAQSVLSERVNRAYFDTATSDWFWQIDNTVFKGEHLDAEGVIVLKLDQSKQIIDWRVFEKELYLVVKEKENTQEQELLQLLRFNGDSSFTLLKKQKRFGYFQVIAKDTILLTQTTAHESNIVRLKAIAQ